MKKPIPKVRGAVLIMATLFMVLLLGIAAFALDLGRLHVLHTEMQNAVDAAALSAAVELDGETGALERAKTAASQDMLNHLAHFSNKAELLDGLEGELHTEDELANPLVFTFYSWIGSSMDFEDAPCTPPTVGPTKGKCLAADDGSDASYVQIRLAPIGGLDDGRNKINLYFLPILSLLGIEGIDPTASTQVVALAGSHYQVCDFPPMVVCGVGDPEPGQMLRLKSHTAGGSWTGAEFGWTIPSEENVEGDPVDISGPGWNDNRRLAHRLGSIYGQGCSDPIVYPGGGNLGGSFPREGLNTRFGIYEGEFDDEVSPYTHAVLESFPSAPNVIDYPRDDELTVKNGDCDLDRTGPNPANGLWDVTECGNINGASPDQQPSTYNRAAYNTVFHDGDNFTELQADPLIPLSPIRADYYNWELSSDQLAVSTLDTAKIHNDETQCSLSTTPPKYLGVDGQSHCRMLDGTPFEEDLNGNDVWVDTEDEYKRRELFVAAVSDCDDLQEDEIHISQTGGKWAEFFLTEHIAPGSDINVYAEFMGYVTESDDEHFKKVIQLYE